MGTLVGEEQKTTSFDDVDGTTDKSLYLNWFWAIARM
jgi:hypothetical protein